eukprot:GHVS01095673.1.p1 GENE.GHVS01095673.1~~GHVS01095673.1.p1  ORF type:complete len:460 (+),score=91.98 GHVS01095673.1:148-1527(+)
MNRLNVVLQQLHATPSLPPCSSSESYFFPTNTNHSNSSSFSSVRAASPSSVPRPLSAVGVSSSVPVNVFICNAFRTPLTRSGKGPLRHLQAEELLIPVFEAVLQRTPNGLPGGSLASCIEDVCIGNVLQPGAGAFSSRIAAILSGLPTSTAVYTVNRLCSSGLQAVANIASAIQSHYIDIGIAGGVESMSQYDMMEMMNPNKLAEVVFEHEDARNCLLPMGVTSENVAAKFGISRRQQDEMAVESQQKAARAQQKGNFHEEIIPVTVTTPEGEVVVVRSDDGVRASTSMEGLAKLKPAFQKDNGTTTAGNSSQVTDGAAMVLLANSKKVKELQLRPLARFVAFAVAGVPPDIMGIGPAVAIPKVLHQAGLDMRDIDVFEINEAFASQATYCVKKLNVPKDKLNPNGGAIALGHPLGCTGSRMIATLLPELRRRKARYGVVSMCIGTGMGAAAVIENLVL